MVNGFEVATSVEPCQHHQRNICMHGSSKEVTKCMQSIIEENSINTGNDGLRTHANCEQFFRALDKLHSCACNYPKDENYLSNLNYC